jgi:hypothetical protein
LQRDISSEVVLHADGIITAAAVRIVGASTGFVFILEKGIIGETARAFVAGGCAVLAGFHFSTSSPSRIELIRDTFARSSSV